MEQSSSGKADPQEKQVQDEGISDTKQTRTKKKTPTKKIRFAVKKKTNTETTETSRTSPRFTSTRNQDSSSPTTGSPRTKETAKRSTPTPKKTAPLKIKLPNPLKNVKPLNQRSPAQKTPEGIPTSTTVEVTSETSPVISYKSTPEKTTSLIVANFEKPNDKTATDKQNRRKTVAKKKSTVSKDANPNEEKEEEAVKKKKKATTNRKRKETESPSATTRSASKKQRLEEEEAKLNKILVFENENKKKEVENKKRKIVVKEKKVVKRQKGKINGKGKMLDEENEDEGVGKFFKSLRAKTTVKPFYNAVHSLSPERKQRVREMGFGTLLGFPYIEFPAKLPYFILKNLDVDAMQVKLPNAGVIDITPSKIREVLGIPMGPISFFAENKRLISDTVYCRFMAQFPENVRKRTTTALSNVIQTTEGTDFLFDLNFLMLFANCLGTCNNTSMLKYHVMDNVMSSKDIPNIDWCEFIWNCIKESKKKWDDTTLENWYYGPHVTFTLIYLHYTQFDEIDVPRKWPAIKNWSQDLVEKRQDLEMAREQFGLVMVVEEDENNEENENQKLRQEVYDRIQENFDRLLKEKKELETSIRVSMEMYEGDETIGRFLQRFNMEFQIGIRTDEFGRVLEDQAGPSRIGGLDDENNDVDVVGIGDDGRGDVNDNNDVDEGASDDDVVNVQGLNMDVQGENIEDQVVKKSSEEGSVIEAAPNQAENIDVVVENAYLEVEKQSGKQVENVDDNNDGDEGSVIEAAPKQAENMDVGVENADLEVEKQSGEQVEYVDVEGEKMDEQLEKHSGEEGHVKEAEVEKENEEKARKEAGVKEKAEKENALKEKAEKDNAEKAGKEAKVKKAEAEKKKQQEEKLEQQKAAKEEEKKSQESKKHQEVLKLKHEQEKVQKDAEKKESEKRKAAARKLNEKRLKEKDARQKENKKQDTEKHEKSLKLKGVQEKAQNEAQKEANEERSNEKPEKEVQEYQSPLIQEKAFGTDEAIIEKKEGKRIVKPSVYLKSPYNNQKANVMEPLTEDERMLAYSLFSMEGYILDDVFDDGHGTRVPRITMQSLSPGVLIDSLVIDAFVSVMNQEERRKLHQERRRYYFPLAATIPEILKPQEARNVNKQIDELNRIMNEDKTSLKLKDVNLVFFPIIAHDDYYVIVFDLQKGSAVILDNSICDGDYNGKYKNNFEFVKTMLVHYLMVNKHKYLDRMLKDSPAKIARMKWRTRDNKIDCGLYMMMHMEMYEGEIGFKWKTNILDEKNRRYAEQMKRMRMRYAAKILLHDVNKNSKMMSDFAIKFDKEHSDKQEQEKMVEEAMRRKAAEEKH